MLSTDLCVAGLVAGSSETAIRVLAGRLLAGGHVHPSFEAAALYRERRSPTGLPFPDIAVAMPHAEPEHVVLPAIAVASLAKPVRFRQMGSPAVELDVCLVVMPAFTEKEQAAAELTRLVELLQDGAVRLALLHAPDSVALHQEISRFWRP